MGGDLRWVAGVLLLRVGTVRGTNGRCWIEVDQFVDCRWRRVGIVFGISASMAFPTIHASFTVSPGEWIKTYTAGHSVLSWTRTSRHLS